MQAEQLTGRVIHKSMFIKASPERVFRAFTEKEELERWFVREATIDARTGGWIRLDWGTETGEGAILRYEPPRYFTFQWDEGDNRGPTTIAVEIIPEGDGSRIELAHSGHGDGDDWDRILANNTEGWHSELDHMQRWLEDGIEKPWS